MDAQCLPLKVLFSSLIHSRRVVWLKRTFLLTRRKHTVDWMVNLIFDHPGFLI